MRLWDSLFSDPNRFEFLLYVCCAIIRQQRAFLLEHDFATCMKKLQAPPNVDMNQLLSEAYALAENDSQELQDNASKSSQLQNKRIAVGKWIRQSFALTSAQFKKPEKL